LWRYRILLKGLFFIGAPYGSVQTAAPLALTTATTDNCAILACQKAHGGRTSVVVVVVVVVLIGRYYYKDVVASRTMTAMTLRSPSLMDTAQLTRG